MHTYQRTFKRLEADAALAFTNDQLAAGHRASQSRLPSGDIVVRVTETPRTELARTDARQALESLFMSPLPEGVAMQFTAR